MSRRLATLGIAGVVVIALMVAAAVVPVPYVALFPGPTTNTLGRIDGTPLISIKGHRNYSAKGNLNLVTVSYEGSPNDRLSMLTALQGWLAPDVALVPMQTIFPAGESVEQVKRETSLEMKFSQDSATTAALRHLGIRVDTRITVSRVLKGYPARGQLRRGDVILRIDGQPITGINQVVRGVSAHQPGEEVSVTVRRQGERLRLEVPTTRGPKGQAFVGISPHIDSTYPFRVNIQLNDVGGPSAGLMFALGIIDKLTKGDLTGGTFVAGTGTIDSEGDVGRVGGVQQKVIGARRAGATVFLTPAANCQAAREAAPNGLRLARVSTLDGALAALEALRSGEAPPREC